MMRPTTPRATAAHNRLLAAAERILVRDGYARLTMERVAAESGAAKTTLYRRWPTKAALCMELYLEVASRELKDPDTGDVAADLVRIASTVVRLQTRTVAGEAFTGLFAEALVSPDTRDAFARFAERRRELTRRVLRRAIARGELRKDTDVDVVIDALGGAVTFRLLQRHARLSKRFIESLVELILSGCRAKARDR